MSQPSGRPALKARIVAALSETLAQPATAGSLALFLGGTSATSVREALAELIAEGVVAEGRETRTATRSHFRSEGTTYEVLLFSLVETHQSGGTER